jgi:hypothetical protein
VRDYAKLGEQSMSMWWLLALIFFAWMLWGAACLSQKTVANAQLPKDKRGSVSLLPVIPVFPLALWGLALLIDLIIDPWGTGVIASLHAIFGLVLIVSIVRDLWRLVTLRINQ